MSDGWIARRWVERPDLAAWDWPASELHEHPSHVPIALRVVSAANVIGRLTLVAPDGLEIDGMRHVPFGVVRAYAILEGVG